MVIMSKLTTSNTCTVSTFSSTACAWNALPGACQLELQMPTHFLAQLKCTHAAELLFAHAHCLQMLVMVTPSGHDANSLADRVGNLHGTQVPKLNEARTGG